MEPSLAPHRTAEKHPLLSLLSSLHSSVLPLMSPRGMGWESPRVAGDGSALRPRRWRGPSARMRRLRLRCWWCLGNAALLRMGGNPLLKFLVLPVRSQSPSPHGQLFCPPWRAHASRLQIREVNTCWFLA